jgi:hypothetical protein
MSSDARPVEYGKHYPGCWRDHLGCAHEYIADLRADLGQMRHLYEAERKRVDEERQRVTNYRIQTGKLLVENDRLRGITPPAEGAT